MVERLKHAIEKARNQRGQTEPKRRVPARAAAPEPPRAGSSWDELRELDIDLEKLRESRVVTHDKSHPAHIAFDLLRTRLLKVFKDNGWRSVAITSPTKGCGKTLVSANLAFSLARQPDLRTVVMDLDLRAPNLARTLRCRNAPQMAWFLSGRDPVESAMQRVGHNLALGLNSERVNNSSEMIQDEKAAAALAMIEERLEPDVIIYDLPPMLVSDDALAFIPYADCVLLIAAAGQTTAHQIEECERQFSGQTNFLGVLLNKAEAPASVDKYEYY